MRASNLVFSSASFELESNSRMNTSLLAVETSVSTRTAMRNDLEHSPIGIEMLYDDSHQPGNIALITTNQPGTATNR